MELNGKMNDGFCGGPKRAFAANINNEEVGRRGKTNFWRMKTGKKRTRKPQWAMERGKVQKAVIVQGW
jgi:hypothetical protein